jgi:hypothetical protein
MAIRSRRESSRRSLTLQYNEEEIRGSLVKHLPAWLLFFTIIAMLLPSILGGLVHVTVSGVSGAAQAVGGAVSSFTRTITTSTGDTSSTAIAPLFTTQIDYWSGDIERWAKEHNLDPNLMATVMQIESCGHPTVGSSAGAQGLFQVMPFHFTAGENQLDPNTNATRGGNFLRYCLDASNGDSGLAMACYNGGPSVLQKDMSMWADETRRYYRWGTGIYSDATQNRDSSGTLNEWLNAGGGVLCQRASTQLGING